MPQATTPPSSLLIFFLSFIFSALLTIPSLASDPLFADCTAENNYTSPSPYATNLRLLIANLISTTPKTPSFFFVDSVDAADSSHAFGLAQCRPDVSPANCSSCLTDVAAFAVNGSCSGRRSASVRYEYCVLRYADHPIASVLEEPSFRSLVRPDVATNLGEFSRQLGGLLTGLLPEAVNSTERIASGMKRIDVNGDSMNFYGLAWCTMDLSPNSCFQCLDHVLKNYEGCCVDKLGGGSMTVSCIVTYNNYAFFNYSTIQARSPSPAYAETGKSKHGHTKKLIIVLSISVSIVSALLVVFIFLICRRKLSSRKTSKLSLKEDIKATKSLVLPLVRLKAATNNFSSENKLGEGRFGPVYKGVLSDGQQIVVKRLSKTSVQGLVELTNEAALVAQLQHKNLVKLLGCCLQAHEKLLVYEYLPNASLDKHLSDPAGRAQLDWNRRHAIIEGIARGLVYLHSHSRLRIILRDLKASNILLDGDMNPKISDFGLAKLVGANESQWNTKQIAGTYGYMAPEYATRGLFSTKSDAFSYGMVVLEIITGRRNCSFIEVGNALNLQTYVWQHWNQGMAERVIDPGLGGQYQLEDVLRCINIGLLCIQADPAERPNMASVVLMLSTNTEALPDPSPPAYFTGENPTSLSSESLAFSVGTDYHLCSIQR